MGSVVKLDGTPEGHEGIYTVLDTGPKVQGRHVDLYMWSCHEALAFGRRQISLTVLRRGWHPNGAAAAKATTRPRRSSKSKLAVRSDGLLPC